MSRINTNVTALISTRILNDNTSDLNQSLKRLSTGLRINEGSDDPAGLIASENLRKQIIGTETAIKNSNRAAKIIGTAEGSLGEISNMLVELQALLGEAANTGGMSTEEIEANQLQADSILNSLDRIANSTEFEGIKLLNGNQAYTVSAVSSAAIADYQINAAKLIDGAAMTVAVTQLSAADTGYLLFSGAGISGGGSMSITVGSGRGTTDLTFAASTNVSAVQYSIQQVREVTGVSAALSTNGFNVVMRSVDFGSDSYASVTHLGSSAQTTALALQTVAAGAAVSTVAKDYGVDAVATINGTSATAEGKKITVRTAMVDAELDLAAPWAMSTTDQTTSFSITGGGSDFALGALVDAVGLESIGFQNVASSSLGNATDGRLNTLKSGGANALGTNNLYTAQVILSDAIKDIAKLRGRLGSFQANTLDTNIASLTVSKENLYAAQSAIRDTDFASETSNLTRSQILVQAATSVLAQANSAPQNVLSLLG